MKRCAPFTLSSLAVALILLSPLPALAGSVTVWPADFRIAWDCAFSQSPLYLAGGSPGTATFFAPVKLPAGVTITGVEYIHKGFYAPVTTIVVLERMRFGEDSGLVGQTNSTDASNVPIRVKIPVVAGMEKVKAGYRYGVTVACENGASHFKGIRITYR
jgi:hypothetical protein